MRAPTLAEGWEIAETDAVRVKRYNTGLDGIVDNEDSSNATTNASDDNQDVIGKVSQESR